MQVNIYIGVGSANTRKAKRLYGYVLECVRGRVPETKCGFGEVEETYNGASLKAINEAMGRMTRPCEIHIHTENIYITNMIETCLETWAVNGFRTSKGRPVKSQEEWECFWTLSDPHLIITEPGEHTYSKWIQSEIRRREEEKSERGADVSEAGEEKEEEEA